MKLCNKCGETKTLTSFGVQKRSKDGLQYYCRVCRAEHQQLNKESISKYRKSHYKENSAKISERKKELYPRYKETISRYQEANKDNISNYWKSNRGMRNYHYNKYRAVEATPNWVDHEWLKLIYIHCPKGYTVDHIIPLQSDIVCGLHVPWNLQYLTPVENSKKHNKLIGDKRYGRF